MSPRKPSTRSGGQGTPEHRRRTAIGSGYAELCRETRRGTSRSAASASVDPSATGPELPHPRQCAIFFSPPTGSTTTGNVACSQRPQLVGGLLQSKAFLPTRRETDHRSCHGRPHPPYGLSFWLLESC